MWRLRNGKLGFAHAVFSRGGALWTCNGDHVKQWKRHFYELLKPTKSFCGERGIWRFQGKNLVHIPGRGSKQISSALRRQGWIRFWRLRPILGCFGWKASWMLCGGTVPVTCQTGMVVPISKRGTWKCIAIIVVSHCSAFTFEVFFWMFTESNVLAHMTYDWINSEGEQIHWPFSTFIKYLLKLSLITSHTGLKLLTPLSRLSTR